MTSEEGLEGDESMSYADIAGRAFSQRNSHCKNPQRKVCLVTSRRSEALNIAVVEWKGASSKRWGNWGVGMEIIKALWSL